jgi:hypothetical protein
VCVCVYGIVGEGLRGASARANYQSNCA